ncbi:MAG: hypothetical protein JOZ83_00160, partial [Silvibacterium sp.]|nr:hypothetical protein [Silvibacterium sp.]
MSSRTIVQEEEISYVSALEATHLPVAPFRRFQARREAWDFAGLGLSLLPFFVCITLIGSGAPGRTYGPSHWFATYGHGFLRRALVGNVLSRVGFLSSRLILGIQLATVTLACLLTALAFRRIVFGGLAERRLA